MACGGLWCDNDIQSVKVRLSKNQSQGGKGQCHKGSNTGQGKILVHQRVITLTKSSVDDMVTYLETLLETPVPEDKSVAAILSDFRYLVGKHFQHKWDNGDKVIDCWEKL